MNEDRFPNVFYIGPTFPGMIFDPTHIGLSRLADTRTLWVSEDRIDRLRSYLIKRGQNPDSSSQQPSPASTGAKRPLYSLLSQFLHNTFQRLDISNLGKLRMKPDLIFVAEVYRRIEGIEKFSCPKAYYIQDPHMGIRRYLDLAHVQDYDFIFVRQKDYIQVLREHGCQHISWIPETFDPDVILGPSCPRDISVIFIGNRYPGTERERMLTVLEQRFGAVNPLAYLKQMASLLRRSNIVFNVSRNGDLNNRVFDAMGAGAMLVTERIKNGLFELFEDRVHLASYSGIKELEEIVDYYMTNHDQRVKIAITGQREVVSKHTNLDRALSILETCLDSGMLPAVRQRFKLLKDQILTNISLPETVG